MCLKSRFGFIMFHFLRWPKKCRQMGKPFFLLLIVPSDVNKGSSPPTQSQEPPKPWRFQSNCHSISFNRIIPIHIHHLNPFDFFTSISTVSPTKIDFLVQSVALSAGGTTVELGLLGSGRLMASARHLDWNILKPSYGKTESHHDLRGLWKKMMDLTHWFG